MQHRLLDAASDDARAWLLAGWTDLVVALLATAVIGVAVVAVVMTNGLGARRRRRDDGAQAPPRPVERVPDRPPTEPPTQVERRDEPVPVATIDGSRPAFADVGTSQGPAATTAVIRRWAKDAGLRVADRGPLPDHVKRAWESREGS